MSGAAGEIRSYRLDPAAFETTTKRRIYRRFAWMVPIVIAFMTVQLGLMSRAQEGAFDSLRISIPLILAVFGFAVFRTIRVQLKNGKPAWDSYQLTIGPNVLRRYIANLPAVEILRTDVTRIVDVEGEGLTMETGDPNRCVFIPEQLIDFESVRHQLAGWRAFEPPKLARSRAVVAGWSVLLLGPWIACGVIPDFGVAMVAGAVLLGVCAFTIRQTLRLTVVDNKHKARTIGALAFLMLAPLARLVMHFAFHVDPQWPR